MSIARRTGLIGPNVPRAERIVTGALGAAAVALGARLRGPLGAALATGGALLAARAATGRCPVYRRRTLSRGVVEHGRVHVARPRDEVYRMWRDLVALPGVLEPVRAITVVDGKVSRWEVVVGDAEVCWSAEIETEVEGERIAWRSLSGRGLDQTLTVELHDATDGGTEVHLELGCRAGERLSPALRALLGAVGDGFLDAELERMARRCEAMAHSEAPPRAPGGLPIVEPTPTPGGGAPS